MSTESSDEKPSFLLRQGGGTAIAAAVGAAAGAAWSAYKKTPLPKGIRNGTITGVVASLGFGGMIYDAIFGSKPASHADQLLAERAATTDTTPQR